MRIMRITLIYCNTIMKMLITEIYSEIILDKTIVSENIQWGGPSILRESWRFRCSSKISMHNFSIFLLISSAFLLNPSSRKWQTSFSLISIFRSSWLSVFWQLFSSQFFRVLRRNELFSATISSIFWSSSETWSRFFLSVLSKTWYLFLHFSISHWRASPSLSMCCSIEMSLNLSPHVNRTIVCLQMSSPRIDIFCSVILFCSSWNDVSAGITSSMTWGNFLHSETLPKIADLMKSGLSSDVKYFHQPGVSKTLIFLPSTSPNPLIPSLVLPPTANSSRFKMMFPAKLFPAKTHPNKTTLISLRWHTYAEIKGQLKYEKNLHMSLFTPDIQSHNHSWK